MSGRPCERALVTGGRGFIGSHLAAGLLARGSEVRILGRPRATRGAEEGLLTGPGLLGIEEEVEIVEADLRDADGVAAAVAGCDAVFHLAAQTYVGEGYATAEETVDVNVRGSRNVFAACREVGVARTVFASSLKAYGAAPGAPYREDLPVAADHPYDGSKAEGDVIAREAARERGTPIAVLRLSNVYGEADLNLTRLVPEASIAVAEGRPPRLRTDGAPRRDFIHVEDAVAAYLAVAAALDDEGAVGEAFNAGGAELRSVREVVDLIAELGGGEVEPEYGPAAAPGEVLDRHLDCTRLRSVTGWEPRIDLRTGLGRTVDWYREHEEVRPGCVAVSP